MTRNNQWYDAKTDTSPAPRPSRGALHVLASGFGHASMAIPAPLLIDGLRGKPLILLSKVPNGDYDVFGARTGSGSSQHGRTKRWWCS